MPDLSLDLAALPKVELHCHLDGVIDPAMARAIRQADPAYPLDPATFEQAYPVNSYESFQRWWSFIAPIEGDLAHFVPILAHHIARLKAERVVYTEIMIAAGELPDDHGAAVEQVAALRRWITAQEGGQIQIEFLVGLGRNKPRPLLEARAARVLALHRAGLIVGVALAGVEPGYPVRPLHDLFVRFHDAGLGIEIHAGEWCGPESIWDALEYGYPNRLGHGISLFQDSRLLDRMQREQIHVEMCPTSNWKTGGVARLADHPIRQAREHGLNFSVNTDDPGVFGCTMQSEYTLLATHFGFTAADFRRITANSLAARFQPQLRVLSAEC